MKFGRHLVENMEPEWAEFYLPYRNLKKMIKALVAKNVAIQATYFREVSLSVPPPTNAAAQVDEDLEGLTQEMFFEELNRQLERMEQFTDKLVKDLKKVLQNIEAQLAREDISEITASVEKEVDRVANEFLRLEKYVNLNITAFSKILKKHDKRLPNPAKSFYMDRIHRQKWVRGDYSDVLMKMSTIYSRLRGDNEEGVRLNEAGVRKSRTVYWVRNEDLTKVKYILLQHLPIADCGEGKTDSRLMTSVYLDNASLELYHDLVDERGMKGRIELRIRWEGLMGIQQLFVERRSERTVSSGDGTTSKMRVVQERFRTDEEAVQRLLEGTFDVDAEAEKLEADGQSPEEIQEFKTLAKSISQMIISKQLAPVVRTQFMRTQFSGSVADSHGNANIDIRLDTNVCMVNERAKTIYKSHAPSAKEFFLPWGTPIEVLANTGTWNKSADWLQEENTSRLPFATLEVQLQLDDPGAVPSWMTQLVTSGMLTQADNFSKYLHASALLFVDEIQMQPSWLKHPAFQQHLLPLKSTSLVGGKKKTVLSHLVAERRQHARNVSTRYHSAEAQIPLLEPAPTPEQIEEDPSCWGWCDTCSDLFASPLRTEIQPMMMPKAFLANERTYIKWVHISIYLAALGMFLLALEDQNDTTVCVLAFSTLLAALLFTLYALVLHNSRVEKIKNGISYRWDDPFGPTLMAGSFSIILLYNFCVELYKILVKVV